MHLPKRWMTGLLSCAVAAAAGGFGVQLGGGAGPAPKVHPADFSWEHGRDEVYRVTEARPLILPYFGDCDLETTVEVHEDSELDVVFRRVEPRIQVLAETRRAGAGEVVEEFVQFHGRFSLLRLSTRREGPPYRTREQALFEPELVGGVQIAAGRPATVRVEMRGRRVRATVAGRALPWFEAEDDHGAIALVAHGGVSVLHYLKVSAVARPGTIHPAVLGAAVAAVIAIVGLLLGWSWWRLALLLGVGLIGGGGVAHALLFEHLLVAMSPSTPALLAAVFAFVPCAVALAAPKPRLLVVIAAALFAAVPLEIGARIDRRKLAPLEDPRWTLVFGPDSGSAPFEALAGRVRDRGPAIHTREPAGTRVMFLGGAAVFEARPDVAEHVGLRTAIALGQRLGREVEGVVLPGDLGHGLQQLELFRRYYLDYRPAAVVFAVSRFESMKGQPRRARQVDEATPQGAPDSSWSVLWSLQKKLRGGDQPVATPEDLRRTLAELTQLAAERKFALVLATEPGIDPGMLRVVEQFAADHRLPLVRDVVSASGEPQIDQLVSVLAELLPD